MRYASFAKANSQPGWSSRLKRGVPGLIHGSRIFALQWAHGKSWLGVLAPVITSGYVFERGFLTDCPIDGRKRELIQRLRNEPAWVTIRRVTITLSQPVDVDKTLEVLEALPKSIRELKVTAHGLDLDGIMRIRKAAAQMTHLEQCEIS